ncbi:MAG: PTS sugar transporter subunit IIA [Anaerolineales bacterium]|nr:PTS sugar transporter subunit IIA [Anaerolineales bacterium]MCK5633670.1 PTS sugar transporter subunit IIA [Anaerolineales bacterium]
MTWISEDCIHANVYVNSWRDAIRYAGQLLVDASAAEPRYVEAMIKTCEELGAYIVIAPGISLPHARPEDGALKNGFAAITLSSPVNFGHPDNDPVSIVVAFSAVDSTSHLESLSILAKLLSRNGFLESATNAQDDEALIRIFTNKAE